MRRSGRTLGVSGLAWLVAVVVGLGAVAFAQSRAGQRLLRDAGIVARDRGLVELAFDAPHDLPTKLSRSPVPVRLRFAITNRASYSRVVAWWVTVAGGTVSAGGSPVRSGSVALAPGESRDPTASFAIACRRRTWIAIHDGSGESIGLWAGCPPARRRVAAPRGGRAATPRGGRAAATRARRAGAIRSRAHPPSPQPALESEG